MREHDAVLSDFIAIAATRGEPDDWQRAPAPGKWSPAAVVLHVCSAYELGRDALARPGAASMHMLSTPAVAWMSRNVLLPLFLATRRFPQGVRAPREVMPDLTTIHSFSVDEALVRLRTAASATADSLRREACERAPRPFTHAYFGPLTPLATLRLLSAHTRHHGRGLAKARS